MKTQLHLNSKSLLAIAVVVLAAGLAPITSTQENDVYAFNTKTDKVLEVCFATLTVDCPTCTSSECPVPDLGGSDRVERLIINEASPTGCEEYLLDGERPFIVYNYQLLEHLRSRALLVPR